MAIKEAMKMHGGNGNDQINDGNDEADATNKVYAGSGNDNIDVGTTHWYWY